MTFKVQKTTPLSFIRHHLHSTVTDIIIIVNILHINYKYNGYFYLRMYDTMKG